MSEPIDQEDPVSPLTARAMEHWQFFETYCKAGFDRSEAMDILLAHIAEDRDAC